MIKFENVCQEVTFLEDSYSYNFFCNKVIFELGNELNVVSMNIYQKTEPQIS